MILTLIALFLAWAVMLLFGTMELDRGLLLLAYGGDQPGLAAIARWLTELGGWRVLLPVTAIGAVVLILRKDWRGTALLLGITLSGRTLVYFQKEWTARIRPDAHEHLVNVNSLSFPSGHSANSLLVWLCLALLLPRTAQGRKIAIWGAILLTFAIGLSRNVLGVHWPSDVLGGWAFGLFWTLLLLLLSGQAMPGGTPISPVHSSPSGGMKVMSENERVKSSRNNDDKETIDAQEPGPADGGAAGGNLQRAIGTQAEHEHEIGGDDGVTRVRDSDKSDGANLPRFNER